MLRRCLLTFAVMCCSGVVAAAAGPSCLYNSRSYSDGAFICVQKSLMLNCSVDGPQATWKVVADRDLNERCTAPMALAYPPEQRQHSRRRHAIRHQARPVAERSAKCFNFNGKQYCE